MKRQGPQVADVKNAKTARCDSNIDWNEGKFVETCIGETTEDSPKEGESRWRTDGDTVAPSATDCNSDAATWGVLGLGDGAEPAVGP